MIKRLLSLSLIALPALLFGRKALDYGTSPSDIGPWLTGPIVTPAAHVIPVGHQNYEPYLSWQQIKGVYNNHWRPVKTPLYTTIQSQTLLQFGVCTATELDFVPTFQYNHILKAHQWVYADTPVAIAFQLLLDRPDEWWPAIKLRISANVPVGKYDRLDPKKFGADLSGVGNWLPSPSIIIGRHYDFGNYHFLAVRLCVGYEFSTSANVHGLSIYGGAPTIGPIKGTRGKVYPGNVFFIEQGTEFSITHNWAIALDLVYQHVNRTRFTGHTPSGSKVGWPSSEQFSVAPAIEYNFNANIGVIFGPWFTVGGRNTNVTFNFINWVFAINIYN